MVHEGVASAVDAALDLNIAVAERDTEAGHMVDEGEASALGLNIAVSFLSFNTLNSSGGS